MDKRLTALSEQDLAIAKLLSRGHSDRSIAGALEVSEAEVKERVSFLIQEFEPFFTKIPQISTRVALALFVNSALIAEEE